MKEIFSFYKAVDPIKGSWDGYGHFPIGEHDFLAFVTDAPSGASIHTPELIKQFWQEYVARNESLEFPHIELADALNRLQNQLQQKGRTENLLYQATIVVVRKIGNRLIYCCIGDSSLQICRGSKLFRLSESEIWDGSLISKAGEKLSDRQKTADLRFIGSNGSFIQTSEIRTLQLKDHDIVLLSSDGLEDLLPPDELLVLLKSSAAELRERLESIFRADRIKDDATMLAVPVHASRSFDAEKEFTQLRRQLDQIQKDQGELRKQLMEISPSIAKLNKLETSFHQISNDLQRSMRRPQSISQSPVSKWMSFPWLIALLCLLLGTVAGAFFLRTDKAKTATMRPTTPEQTAPPASKRTAIAPPEIPAETNCAYIVQKGDSLDKIATSKAVPVSDLLRLNPRLKREVPLKIGQSIVLCKEENP